MSAGPVFFPDAAAFRRWLEANHAEATELFVGFHRKDTGRGGLTYAEAVLEALCFGWIDGVIRSLGSGSYQHRFTPRKPGSVWSKVNVAHVARLTAAGRMAAAGRRAFAARTEARTGIYSFEQAREPRLPAAFARRFRAVKPAWEFFSAQPAWYRRQVIHGIVSAKQPATRERRLERAIAASAAGERLR
jgi:uncharacterized protein YdeI (YjbR/CyaY-like superfamily)